MTPAGKSTSRTSSSGARKKAPASRARKPASPNARKPSSESSSGSDAKDAKDSKEDSKTSQRLNLKRERTPFEWALLTVALAAIGTVIVGLFLYAGHKAGGEAVLEIEVAETGKTVDGGPQVEVTVKNVGGSGAEQIVVEVTMGEETREVTMTRIPKDDEASTIVAFPEGTTGTPEGELLSYNTP